MKTKAKWCEREIHVAELGAFLLVLGTTLFLAVLCLELLLIVFGKSVIIAFIMLLTMAGGILMIVDFLGTLWKDVFR